MTIKICTQCILDTTVQDIWFDEQGKCKYCYINDEMEKLHPLDGSASKRLEAIVQQIKDAGKGKKYDCIAGVSGGILSAQFLPVSRQSRQRITVGQNDHELSNHLHNHQRDHGQADPHLVKQYNRNHKIV